MKIYKKYLVIGIIILLFTSIITTARNSKESQKKLANFSENFEDYLSAEEVFPPPGWLIEQMNPSSTWFKNVAGTTKYAICTEISSTGLQDEKLITCTLNCTGLTGIYVKFDKYFYSSNSYDSKASVSFSIDNGSSWTILDSWIITDNLSTEVFTLPSADGKDRVKVRWRFESSIDVDKSDYYWFDNVYIGNGVDTLYETNFDENNDDIIIDLLPGIYSQANFVLKFANNCYQPRYNINYLISWTTLSSIPPKYPSGFITGIINISAPQANLTVQSGPMNTSGFIVIAKIVITATADCAASVSRNALLFKFGQIKIIVISLVKN